MFSDTIYGMRKLVAGILILFILFIGFLWWKHGNAPVNPRDTSQKVFVVNRGEGIRAIGNDLKKEGLINDPIVFFLLIKKEGKDNAVQAGDYKLSPSMNLQKILDSLSHGTLDIWVTIPEGLRAEEIADLLQKDIPSYKDAWRVELDKNEGYLFPDTYLIPRDAEVETIISIMRNNFDTRMKQGGVVLDNPKLADAVIIASIIEKEAKFAADMPLVSSVIHNRIENGMALQVDPSVAYALGRQPNGKFGKAELTFDDLKIDSPYNTYANVGLPPTAISNPGVTAIQAALHPISTDYLYYISDKKGHIHAAKTLEGHQANINKYL